MKITHFKVNISREKIVRVTGHKWSPSKSLHCPNTFDFQILFSSGLFSILVFTEYDISFLELFCCASKS